MEKEEKELPQILTKNPLTKNKPKKPLAQPEETTKTQEELEQLIKNLEKKAEQKLSDAVPELIKQARDQIIKAEFELGEEVPHGAHYAWAMLEDKRFFKIASKLTTIHKHRDLAVLILIIFSIVASGFFGYFVGSTIFTHVTVKVVSP